jgi:O-antigen/teichoic acid export membrane protein
MDLTFFQEYLVLVVLGICLCAGYIIKHSLTFIPNKYIPLLMGILGVLLNVWLNMGFTPEILLGGLASGLASTGAYEGFRNVTNKE